MTRSLIINADDYGHTPGTSEGIRQAHLNGVVTSTTSMMNGPYIDRELPELIRQCPRIGTGVHLVITIGEPILPVEKLPHLMALSPDGKHFFKEVGAFLDLVDPVELKAEWTAQIEKFIQLTGRAPDHLDAHHHAMCFGEPFFRVYLELARDYGSAVRPMVDGSPMAWNRMVQEMKVPIPTNLDTRFYDEGVTKDMLATMIAEMPEGVTEWMCHPGLADDQIRHISNYNDRRKDEVTLLTDPDLRLRFKAAGVKLINFGELTA